MKKGDRCAYCKFSEKVTDSPNHLWCADKRHISIKTMKDEYKVQFNGMGMVNVVEEEHGHIVGVMFGCVNFESKEDNKK